MRTNRYATLAFTMAAALLAADITAPNALAAVIFSNTVGAELLGGSGYEGHSFTMPPGNAYNNVTFSWVSANHSTKLAAGNLFLLSQEFLSRPTNLSAATPGYMSQSTGIVNSAYVFPPSVTLNPSSQYWVYMGGAASLAGGGYTFSNPFAGGKAYERFPDAAGDYYNNGVDLDFNFILSGNVVPEPTSICLVVLALLSVGLSRRR
jgi:hypothetical protein